MHNSRIDHWAGIARPPAPSPVCWGRSGWGSLPHESWLRKARRRRWIPSGTNLADCASSGHRVLMPDTHGDLRITPGNTSSSNTFRRTATDSGHKIPGRSIRVSEYEPELRRHRELMSTEAARSMYKRRQGLVEPVFGLLKECHGARRFLLRGRENVLSEWCLLAAAFNLKSLHRVWSAASPSDSPHTGSPRLHPRCGRGAIEATRNHHVPRRTAQPCLATRRLYTVYRSSPVTCPSSHNLCTPHETMRHYVGEGNRGGEGEFPLP